MRGMEQRALQEMLQTQGGSFTPRGGKFVAGKGNVANKAWS